MKILKKGLMSILLLLAVAIPGLLVGCAKGEKDNAVKASGLYQNNVLVKTWSEIIEYAGSGYISEDTILLFPKALEGELIIDSSIKTISARAFEDHCGLTKVTIPEGVTKINVSTFSGCKNLESVEIKGKVTIIGSSAFSGCQSLKNITLPNSVTTIEDDAFSNCKNLNNIIIPYSVESIDSSFDNCDQLSTVIVDSYSIVAQFNGTSTVGYLFDNAIKIYVKDTIMLNNNNNLLKNYIKQESSDKLGYDLWIYKNNV